MHWTDGELRTLYQLAAQQPRDWVCIADALRRLYPDRRQYTVSSVQQKYNEAVRVPVWGADELDLLRKYGTQFPGQWERITLLMKATFGASRRPYMGEILERKWKQLRRDDSESPSSSPSTTLFIPLQPGDSPVRSDALPPNTTNGSLPTPTPPGLDPTSDADRSLSIAPEEAYVPALMLPSLDAPGPGTADPPPAPVAMAVASEAAAPSTPEPSCCDDQGGGGGGGGGESLRFNPEEAAEILADFGHQFANELELSLTTTLPCANRETLDTLPVSMVADRSLTAAAALADGRCDPKLSAPLFPLDNIEDEQIDESKVDVSPVILTDVVVVTAAAGMSAADDEGGGVAAASRPRFRPSADSDSSAESDPDSDSKAPISSRIQKRRLAKDEQQQQQQRVGGRVRKRAKSLDVGGGGHGSLRPKQARRLPPSVKRRAVIPEDDSDDGPSSRRSATDTDLDEDRRSRAKKARAAVDHDDAEPRRTRRVSESDGGSGRHHLRRAASGTAPPPSCESRRQSVWSEDEERHLAELCRVHGTNWEKIGAALLRRFPGVRQYSVVSVRCKWNHMLRHDHPLAFDSSSDCNDGDEESESAPASSATAKADEIDVDRKKTDVAGVPARDHRDTDAALTKTKRAQDDGDDDYAICDADAPDSLPKDAAVGVVAVSAEPSLLWTLLQQQHCQAEADNPELMAHRLSLWRSPSDEEVAICEV